MHKGLLVWNIILTTVLVGGFLAGYFFISSYHNATEQEMSVLHQNVNELSAVVAQQSEAINEHAQIINGRMGSISEEVAAAIENNDKVIQEMNSLVQGYQEVINTSAASFEEILKNLESLSITKSEEPSP